MPQRTQGIKTTSRTKKAAKTTGDHRDECVFVVPVVLLNHLGTGALYAAVDLPHCGLLLAEVGKTTKVRSRSSNTRFLRSLSPKRSMNHEIRLRMRSLFSWRRAITTTPW